MKPNEDLMASLESVASALDVNIRKDNIVKRSRIMKAPAMTHSSIPSIIVAKFGRQDLRDELIARQMILQSFEGSIIHCDQSVLKDTLFCCSQTTLDMTPEEIMASHKYDDYLCIGSQNFTFSDPTLL
ncbi:uncharacterized protein LOC117179147 [Belonocnema kinseyi]|uniref:uncharacterized protein LOC117179147 n=1 Tax=Belonocnema kinseyi TaxID=2817044 RepID=UPI00143CC9A7|nr:uncharacterized protein LOC117179147 [Belonocnema kinseyi]